MSMSPGLCCAWGHRCNLCNKLEQQVVHPSAIPEALFKICVLQLHEHAGRPDVVDGVQDLLQLIEGAWGSLQLLSQILNLLFQLLQHKQSNGQGQLTMQP